MRSTLPPGPAANRSSDAAPAPVWLAELRGPRFWVLAGALLGLVVVAAVALRVASPSAQVALGKLARIVGMLFAALCCFWVTRRAAPGRERLAWGCITLGVVGYVLAETINLAFSPRPGIVALLSTPFYILGATGVIALPGVQTRGIRLVYVLLDVGIIVGALYGLGFVFTLARLLNEGRSLDYSVAIIPFVDVTAGLAFVVLLGRGVEPGYRRTFLWLIFTAACFFYGDGAANMRVLMNLSTTPGLGIYDAIWMAGAFAVGLAALARLRAAGDVLEVPGWLGPMAARTRRFWPGTLLGRFLVTALPVMLLIGLLIFITLDRAYASADVLLAVLTGLVMLLIIARLLLTMRDLVAARQATERAEQLDSLKDQFITSVNHELRTPLMTMKGYLSLLTDPRIQAPPERRAEMLGRANRSCESLVYLVQGILDTRRIDQEASDFTPEAISVQAAMQAALSLIDPREADPATRQVVMEIPDDLLVWGEAVRLQQILTNLVSNAIKYSPAGTPVTIRGRAVSERTGRLLGYRASSGPMVELTVQDEGLGIPPEQKDLLFRRFVRLPRDIASPVRGTGLGLYLCRVFAEAMGGAVWVESTGEPGDGSTFHVRLPMPPQTAPTAPLAAVETHPQRG